MRIDVLWKIIYGCIAGQFIQKVIELVSGKKGSIPWDTQLVGLFAVFSDNTSIAGDQYILIGEVEYDKILYKNASAIYDILANSNMVSNRFSFSRLYSVSQNAYPDAYGYMISNSASGRFVNKMTQLAVLRAFKELTT